MRVEKWGNHLAIRLPTEVVVADERVFQVRKKAGKEALLAWLRRFRGKLPADFKFDRNDANART